MQSKHVSLCATFLICIFIWFQELLDNGIVLNAALAYTTSLIDPWTFYGIIDKCDSHLCVPVVANNLGYICIRLMNNMPILSGTLNSEIHKTSQNDISTQDIHGDTVETFEPDPQRVFVSPVCRILMPRCFGRCIELGFIDALSKTKITMERPL